MSGASVMIRQAEGPARAVVLVLHGGAEWGHERVYPWRLAYLRMVPLARALHRAGAGHGIEVQLLRNSVRGWNEPDLDPVRDARWALSQVAAEHPGLPVVLVGHSMGGRVALRVADDPAVAGVCALAPWAPKGEPVLAGQGTTVLIMHGLADRMTDPRGSYAYARDVAHSGGDLVRFELAGEGHAMLRRSPVWSRLVCSFTLEVLGVPTTDGTLADAWSKPSDQRLRIPL